METETVKCCSDYWVDRAKELLKNDKQFTSTFKKWEGKLAVVVGGNSGIGGNIAVRLATLGLTVVTIDVDSIKIEKAANLLGEDARGEIIPYNCEYRKVAEFRTAMEWIEDNYGEPYIQVNCPALYRCPHIITIEDGLWKKLITIIVSIIGIVSAEFSRMKRDYGGHIVNVTFGDVYATIPAPNEELSSYMERILTEYTAHLKKVFGPRLRVTNVFPGALSPYQTESVNEESGYGFLVDQEKVVNGVLMALSRPRQPLIKKVVVEPEYLEICKVRV